MAPAFNHTPVRVGISNATGLNLSMLRVSSDAGWVTPTLDASNATIVLTFATANLVASSYTATITAASSTETNAMFVRAYVSPLNVFKLKDDPLRSRTYGVQQNGLGLGSVIVLDPVTTNHIGNVTVGRKPSDLAVSANSQELFVINCVDETISVIDLTSLTLKETLMLPAFDNWGASDTTANVGVGPGNILYYTDGAWAPALRVLNRSTMQVIQTNWIDGNGFGDFGVTSDKTLLFGWAQYGWSAGWAGSYIARFTISPNGLLTFTRKTDGNWPTVLQRDPLETPILISSDNRTVFVKQHAVDADSLALQHGLPTPVYSITPGGEVAVTDIAIYETETGLKLADLPRTAPVQAISSDYSRLIYFDSALRAVSVLNLVELIGPGILNRDVVPADGSITLSPPRLQWRPMPGVDAYHVYLGTSETAVTSATTNSPLFLGSANQPSFTLAGALTPGTKYFWRVDAVTAFDVAKGDVREFTVSLIASSTNEISAVTVRGHADFKVSFQLSSQNPGSAWSASANQAWVGFLQSTGSTPGSVTLVLNASQLSNGLHRADVAISSGGTALFSIPVKFRVEPVNLTIVKSDPESVFVYAISEDPSTTPTRAYLLEINSLTESIHRVVQVGASATDLALHKGDNRIYVPNWLTGSLLAVDLTSFQQVRAYPFSPFGGTGYSENDIYRVSAGVAGRLIWEEQDQWIDINIFDTVGGTNIASAFVREGGGSYDPTGRYYYHGDNNSSGAQIHKFDVIGDRFTELAAVRVESASYYGSRTVVVSEDGSRVFWNGAVFDADLGVEWDIGEMIYATSRDGGYAFADTKVYDVNQRTLLTNTTPSSSAKAFNSLTDKVVFKQGNSIGYMKLDSHDDVLPLEGAIVHSPAGFQWEAVPTISAYHFYLGQSRSQVASAGTNSPAFRGSVTAPSFALPNTLTPGPWFWRVDALTPYGTVIGQVHTFTVSPLIPNLSQINAATFENRPVIISLSLTSELAGITWQASSADSWISLSQSNGTGSGAIQVTLNASLTAPTVRNGSITLTGSGLTLFTVPVTLTIEPLRLTIIKSDPASHKAYAISEDTTRSPTRAFLLEIDTVTETIERVMPVGASVTDLAIHNGDNRLYVPNWLTGSLLAIDKTTFEHVRSYAFAPFGGTGYGEGDVYRVSAGAPGRVVVEAEDQWIDITIFNTATGTALGRAFVREGGGGFDPTGRYYYHGDNNSSGAEIHKYDVTGDAFSELAHIRVQSVSYYGSRTVVVSEDGSRIFWNGSVFNANLVEEWTIADEIFSASSNGKYAFSRTKVYDIDQKRAVLGMPVVTSVSAFNSTTHKLVVQVGNVVRFFPITDPLTLLAPVLSTGQVTYTSVVLNWQDRSLEDNFTLQRRTLGSVTWQDIATVGQNVASYSVTGLNPETTYEFRIKANAATVSSDWSTILTVTTPAVPPTPPSLNTPIATVTSVNLTWSNPSYESQIILERSVSNSVNWSIIATLPADTTAYTDNDVLSLRTYYYRVKAQNGAGDSPYSIVRSVTVPAPSPPATPIGLIARATSNATLVITWNDVSAEAGYRLERRNENPASWALLAQPPANITNYHDTNVVLGMQYWYRVLAFNSNGNSQYSMEASAIPARIVNLIQDDFDPDVDPLVWADVSGGVATNGGQGFRGSKALFFSEAGQRSATTIPMDVSSGGTLEFWLRAGNEAADGPLWNNSEQGEGVVLEFAKDGLNWGALQIQSTVYPSLSTWTKVSVTIPTSAYSGTTRFRWRQSGNSGPGFDVWALEDLVVHGPAPEAPEAVPFVISSPSSCTSIAILWIPGSGAASYVVERRQGAQAWTRLATVAGTYYTDESLMPQTAYSYRVQAVNAGGAAAYSPVTTTVTWSQVEQWAYDNFGNPDSITSTAMTSPLADGTLPLLRYAFNLGIDEPARYLGPGEHNGFPRIWFNPARHRLWVEFVRRKPAMNPGVSYHVQFSSDLTSWTSSGVEVTRIPIDAVWERVCYEDRVDAPEATPRFARVGVTMP